MVKRFKSVIVIMVLLAVVAVVTTGCGESKQEVVTEGKLTKATFSKGGFGKLPSWQLVLDDKNVVEAANSEADVFQLGEQYRVVRITDGVNGTVRNVAEPVTK